jgi:DNA-directed RNA polymerase subunit RPC12/RpoP
MGRKKRFIKIPKTAKIKCPHCGVVSKRKVPEDSSPQYFDCDKCGKRTLTPITQCCVVCAFTKTKCAYSLKMEAKAQGLEVR